MTSRALTPANQITILRLIFVPLFAILVIGRHYGAALAVLIGAALSDMLDGAVARVFKQESPLGVALDPIADKILMTTAFLTLSFRGILPWWITILVISRDAGILVTALLISLVSGYRPFHPTFLGKVSTAVQVATVFAACSFAAHIPPFTRTLVRISVYLAAALTVASAVHYLVICGQRYVHSQPEQIAASPEIRKPDQAETSANTFSATKSSSPRSS